MTDVVEEVTEAVDHLTSGNLNGTTKGQQAIVLGLVGGGAALVSGVATYFVTKRKLEGKLRLEYAEMARQEIEQSQAYMRFVREKPDPADILAAHEDSAEAASITQKYAGIEPSEERIIEVKTEDGRTVKIDLDQQETAREIVNAFSEGDDPTAPKNGWDYETEVARRSAEVPYVISEEEFFENADEKEQVSFTYFEGDGVLVDEQDKPVGDDDHVNSLVGADNLLRFGQGTKDKNMVHVRNDKLDMEFEIARSKGKYSVEVLGFDDEDSLQHSGRRRPQRFRPDDD